MEDQPHSHVRLDLVTDLSGTLAALEVFRAAWGRSDVQDVDTYFAAASHGSYLAVGRLAGEPVVAAFGFLSVDPVTGEPGLHSHMAAVVPPAADKGFGQLIKRHQRDWCAERGIQAITWTFDPLQRRNAWFNLVRLGATVIGFRRNLYGSLDDQINGTDETDRLEVRWLVDPSDGAGTVAALDGDEVVAVPADIGALRRKDPGLAAAARERMRVAFAGIEEGTHTVVGMSLDREYVVRPNPTRPVALYPSC